MSEHSEAELKFEVCGEEKLNEIAHEEKEGERGNRWDAIC